MCVPYQTSLQTKKPKANWLQPIGEERSVLYNMLLHLVLVLAILPHCAVAYALGYTTKVNTSHNQHNQSMICCLTHFIDTHLQKGMTIDSIGTIKQS